MKNCLFVAFACVALSASAASALSIEDRLAQQRAAYDAEVAKNIIDLQMYRHEQNAVLPDGATHVQLISLNPNINSWFLLGVGQGNRRTYFHLENPAPDARAISLEDGASGPEILITEGRRSYSCKPWEGEPTMLTAASQANLPYSPICDSRLYLRVPTRGNYTSLEATSQFLRDHIWGGDALVDFVKATLNKDKYALDGTLGEGGGNTASDGPPSALVRYPDGQRPLVAAYHEFKLDDAEGGMVSGIWYPVRDHRSVFVSAIQPRSVSDEVMSVPGANWLDGVEGSAIAYLIAFDLSKFELAYSRGTEHPRLDWSPRPPHYVRKYGLPGPDGFGTDDPLVSLGMAASYDTDRLVATFTGGFKRQHGAFRGGPLAGVNYGSHYGLLEHGVVFSKLWPGLSTITVAQDGSIDMKTWEESDYEVMPNLRFARQNGTPLVENGQPGPYVTQWMAGNWSGSANADLRTLRAGACMIKDGETQYLVYAYFSTATPSAMTRTFMAYGCDYAMLLDMNAQEHTYLGLYTWKDGKIQVDHIANGMDYLDKSGSAGVIPRFVGYPDNRDVFYLMRKE
ncbi:hypothetical protein [Pseudoruegeria sp. HB172150]|uniref:hypothetical protein n=1 Tax=Pseudoruegeria sp. HB172150 TaxID=2721164 RepID=UPI00155436AE|nr:hypothetical protein [Pseudoruegeria sp. HB172150]